MTTSNAPAGRRCAVCGEVLIGSCRTASGRHWVGTLTPQMRAAMVAPARRTWAERQLLESS
jgi:hypothetical protein